MKLNFILVFLISLAFCSSANAKTTEQLNNNIVAIPTKTNSVFVTAVNDVALKKWQKNTRQDINIPTPKEMGADYDKKERNGYKMPEEWFYCKNNDDCTLVKIPCSTSLSVNKSNYEKAHQLIGDNFSCLQSIPDTSSTFCKNSECVTIINRYEPK